MSQQIIAKLLNRGVILLFGGLCVLDSAAQGNIVQNGGFNSPDGNSIPGWTYPGYILAFNFGADGGGFVGIDQYISQNLSTLPGQTYVLQFSIMDTLSGITQDGPNGVGVQWGSQDLGIFPLVHPSTNWISHQLSVTALYSQTTLKFTQAYGPWPFLDAVSVVAIPEPRSLTLVWLGLSFMFVLRQPKVFRLRNRFHANAETTEGRLGEDEDR